MQVFSESRLKLISNTTNGERDLDMQQDLNVVFTGKGGRYINITDSNTTNINETNNNIDM